MFKNYLKIGWRNLLKQRMPSVINIFGLACALACCLVAYLFISSIWLRGINHEKRDQIFMVTHTAEKDDGLQRLGYTALPLAGLFEKEFSSVKQAVRVVVKAGTTTYKANSFNQRTQFVDPEFMDMFTYQIRYGSRDALREAHQVVITNKTADKLFGTSYPIGQELELLVNDSSKIFAVGAVLEPLPSTEMFYFDMLVNIEQLKELPSDTDKEWAFESWVFVEVEKGSNLASMKPGLDRLAKTQNVANPDSPYSQIQLEPFTTLVKNAHTIEGGIGNQVPMGPQIVLAAIAIFMLVLAVLNYINISLLMAIKRIKEIGVRKVIGGRKSQLILQFLIENFLTCAISVFLGGVIAAALFLPWFNQIAMKNLQLDIFHDIHLLVFLGILLIFITIASGAYSAFYISSFKPVRIFAARGSSSNTSKFSGVLLGFQLVLALVTIVGGIAFVQTNNSNQDRDWGYDQSDKIVVNIPTGDDYMPLRDKLSQQPDILSMAGSFSHIGRGDVQPGIAKHNNKNYDVNIIRGASNYPDVMGLRLIKGRMFNALHSSATSAIVNQTFMDRYRLKIDDDEMITLDSATYHIVGVVEDFHYDNFGSPIEPTVILTSTDTNFNYLTLKVTPGTTEEVATSIKALWHETVAGGLYSGQVQASIFDRYFDDMKGVRNILLFTAVLAIVLAAMGLFGLVSLSTTSKMKAYSIRKVLGANITQLSKIMYKRYLIIWVIACLLGCGLASFGISQLLNMTYSYHPGIGVLPFVVAVCILMLVIAATVGIQLIKVKHTNPVQVLRKE